MDNCFSVYISSESEPTSFLSLPWLQVKHEIILHFAESPPCTLSNDPGSTVGPAAWERVTRSPCFISSSFRNLFCRLVGSRLWDCPTALHDCNEWSLSGRLHDSKAPRSSHLQKPKRANMCTFVPKQGKKGSLASCALCSASLRPLCLFQRLLPSRDLTKQI